MTPTWFKPTGFNEMMNGGMGPIGGVVNMTVFDWVVMDVIDVLLQVLIIFDGMFPIPSLPIASLTSA